jgi:dUTP pyrophosphatase
MSKKLLIEKLLSSTSYDDFLNISEKVNMSDLSLQDNLMITDKMNELKKAKYFSDSKIRFTYSKDEYGELAKELHEKNGTIRYAYPGDAGFDLPIVLSKEDIQNGSQTIWPHERGILHTGMIFEFPIGYHGRIVHRSSCEKNYRLRVIEGIIDDYRGEVLIQVANQNSCQVVVRHGNKLAQMIVLPNSGFEIEPATELRPSKRSARGFGSSGK